jgi:hypothetical protein
MVGGAPTAGKMTRYRCQAFARGRIVFLPPDFGVAASQSVLVNKQ